MEKGNWTNVVFHPKSSRKKMGTPKFRADNLGEYETPHNYPDPQPGLMHGMSIKSFENSVAVSVQNPPWLTRAQQVA